VPEFATGAEIVRNVNSRKRREIRCAWRRLLYTSRSLGSEGCGFCLQLELSPVVEGEIPGKQPGADCYQRKFPIPDIEEK
jgi:hypothetical protein